MPNEHVLNPWLDFKYGDNYASDFGLIRVSNGSRYNDNLLPTLNDKTADIPGGDGMYYFNSYYKQKQFNINFAFDHLTEQQLRDVRQWLNGKEIKELEFDEAPGRIYSAKVTGTPSLKYIPFDEYTRFSSNIEGTLYIATPVSNLTQETIDNWGPTSGRNVIHYVTGRNQLGVAFSAVTQGHSGQSRYMIGSPGISTGNRNVLYFAWLKESPYQLSSSSNGPLTLRLYTTAEYDFWSQFFNLTLFGSTASETPTAIYKGEGSVTFTCYDPYAHSEQKRISGLTSASNTFTLGGDLPTPCLLTHLGQLLVGDSLTLKRVDNDEVLGKITLLTTHTAIQWNTKTGLVLGLDTGGVYYPIAFKGNSVVTLPPGVALYLEGISNTAYMDYYERYY